MTTPPPTSRLSLRDELYLLAHDDDTGRPHIHTPTLSIGLAGATLIDLHLTGRIVLNGQHILLTGQEPEPIEDMVTTLATAIIRHSRNPSLRPWFRGIVTHLYDFTRHNLTTTGVLEPITRRHLAGLIKTRTHLATSTTWAVRARAQLRGVVTGREEPDNHTGALSGLTAALHLEPFLYLDEDNSTLQHRLRVVTNRHHPDIRTIIHTVDALVGDLAVNVYR